MGEEGADAFAGGDEGGGGGYVEDFWGEGGGEGGGEAGVEEGAFGEGCVWGEEGAFVWVVFWFGGGFGGGFVGGRADGLRVGWVLWSVFSVRGFCVWIYMSFWFLRGSLCWGGWLRLAAGWCVDRGYVLGLCLSRC